MLKPLLASLALGASPLLLMPALAQDHDHGTPAAPAAQAAPGAPQMCPMMKGMTRGRHGDAKPMGQSPQGSMPMGDGKMPGMMTSMHCMRAETPPPSAVPEAKQDHDHSGAHPQ